MERQLAGKACLEKTFTSHGIELSALLRVGAGVVAPCGLVGAELLRVEVACDVVVAWSVQGRAWRIGLILEYGEASLALGR